MCSWGNLDIRKWNVSEWNRPETTPLTAALTEYIVVCLELREEWNKTSFISYSFSHHSCRSSDISKHWIISSLTPCFRSHNSSVQSFLVISVHWSSMSHQHDIRPLVLSQNAMLPAGMRQRDQTKKGPTGPYDRDALMQYLEKEAIESPEREDLVPFTGEKKG